MLTTRADTLAHAAPDELDLDQVYRRHAAMVSRWIQRLAGPGDPRDVLHEVFVVAQRRAGDFRGDSKITTWLYGITVRVVTARRRRETWRRLLWKRFAPEIEAQPELVETPLEAAERGQATRAVYSILDTLPERDRTLLILFELENLSAEEIAQVLVISPNNVWVSVHRARKRFRAAFEERYPGELDRGEDDPER